SASCRPSRSKASPLTAPVLKSQPMITLSGGTHRRGSVTTKSPAKSNRFWSVLLGQGRPAQPLSPARRQEKVIPCPPREQANHARSPQSFPGSPTPKSLRRLPRSTAFKKHSNPSKTRSFAQRMPIHDPVDGPANLQITHNRYTDVPCFGGNH